MGDVKIEGYLVLEPTHVWGPNGVVTKAKLARATQRPPVLGNNERAVKISITVPASVFGPVAEVAVTVPEGDVIVPVVEVG